MVLLLIANASHVVEYSYAVHRKRLDICLNSYTCWQRRNQSDFFMLKMHGVADWLLPFTKLDEYIEVTTSVAHSPQTRVEKCSSEKWGTQVSTPTKEWLIVMWSREQMKNDLHGWDIARTNSTCTTNGRPPHQRNKRNYVKLLQKRVNRRVATKLHTNSLFAD